ncbi:MAG: hypothetical protein KAS32_09145 [Candidatus Peribacteraceae bacterium]|nr:hypothetical protein [Candidatus Peribacteraceae bacterium]
MPTKPNMIVKVQISIGREIPSMFIYNEDRSVQYEGPTPKSIVKEMRGSPKEFFTAYINDKQEIALVEKIAQQDW